MARSGYQQLLQLLSLLCLILASVHCSTAPPEIVDQHEDTTISLFDTKKATFFSISAEHDQKSDDKSTHETGTRTNHHPLASKRPRNLHGMTTLAASAASARKLGKRGRSGRVCRWSAPGARALSFLAPSLRQHQSLQFESSNRQTVFWREPLSGSRSSLDDTRERCR